MLGLTAAFMITLVLGVVLRSKAHEMPEGGSGGGSRGGGAGKKFTLRDGFLWGACLSLFASGTFAVNTIVGSFISSIASLAIWVGWCWAIVLVAGIIKDIWSDREPDKVAPWFLFLLPSVTNNLGGEFGNLLKRMWSTYGDVASEQISRIFGV